MKCFPESENRECLEELKASMMPESLKKDLRCTTAGAAYKNESARAQKRGAQW